MSIQLHYSPGSCSIASHILLNDTGVPFEAIRTNAKGGLPQEYRTINPKMRVPILIKEGEIVTETTAILTAISQLVPDRQLTGRTPLEIVKVYEWMNWVSGTLHGQAWRGVLRPVTFTDDESAFEGIQQKCLKHVVECYQLLEDNLGKSGGPFALGEHLTIVDFALYAYWRWGTSRSLLPESTHPRYNKLIAELCKRESVKKTIAIEGVEDYFP